MIVTTNTRYTDTFFKLLIVRSTHNASDRDFSIFSVGPPCHKHVIGLKLGGPGMRMRYHLQ